MKTFKGRVVLAGNVEGEALVTRQGFNTLATYLSGLPTNSPICHDQNNPDLYQKHIAGKILCLPVTIGSTTGGMVLQCAAAEDIAPAAMLYAEHIDTVSAPGIILADIWNDKQIVTIDQLGHEFLDYVKEGQKIVVSEDGTVEVH
jgi:predicted aconitase with swiveling domain